MTTYSVAPVRQPPNVGLNILRGLAALLVVLGHSRDVITQVIDPSLMGSALQKILLAPTSFGQESVAIFFVLSGYLVGGQVIREVREDRFSWRSYMAKRLSRLWTVLIPGIGITFILDMLGQRAFSEAWAKIELHGSYDLGAAACNAVFLQKPHCWSYGSNGSLWSLAYEFWFYVLFAGATVAAFCLIRKKLAAGVVGLVVVAASLAIFGLDLLTLLPSWLLGVVLAVVHARWKERGTPGWMPRPHTLTTALTVLLLAAGMVTSNVVRVDEWLRFILVGALTVPMVLVLAMDSRQPVNRAWARLGMTGDWSFSTYVYHLPILKVLIAAVAATGGFGAIGNAVLVYVLAAVAAMLCIPLWYVTENRTSRVRSVFLRVLGVRARVRTLV